MSREIFLHPCDLWFGSGQIRLRTVLGSCVAITLWHPRLRLGGMCHYMISGAPDPRKHRPDDCYADSAMEVLEMRIRARNLDPREFEAKLFGGGQMFPWIIGGATGAQIQARNIAAGRDLAHHHGHRVVAEHVGGDGHRQLIFDIQSGQAWLKHITPTLFTCPTKESTAWACP